VLASLDQSLKRLGLDYVDIFYSHRFDPDTPLEETLGALDAAVRQGKALYVGISSYSAVHTRAATHILARLGTPLLIHQPSYSLLNRWIETECLFTACPGSAHRPLPGGNSGWLPGKSRWLTVDRHAQRG
jgi:L-glyceraldehyde 3-phosphate reductase